jgi:hypothetical protein
MDTKNKYSLEYIKSITHNKSGFSTPENYFDSVEDTVFSKVKEQSFSKGNVFIAPKDYFNNFEDSLFANVNFPKKEVKIISLKSRLLKFIPTAAAASILLFIGLNIFTTKDPFNTISSDDLNNWFDENYIDHSTVNAIEFVDTDFTESTILEDETSLDDEDILDYLNTIDSSNLLIEIES